MWELPKGPELPQAGLEQAGCSGGVWHQIYSWGEAGTSSGHPWSEISDAAPTSKK